MSKLDSKIQRKFEEETIIWMATVRPDGRPHLIPIWFVTQDNSVYVRTMKESVKFRNLLQNPKVSISVQDGSKPIIGEGEMIEYFSPGTNPEIDHLFDEKYDWTDYDSRYNVICRFRIHKWMVYY